MLGVRSNADVEIERVVDGIQIVRRKTITDDETRGFAWGSLTSGSARKAMWIALLPLTITNVAGWAATGSFRRTQQRIVHALAGLATAAYVFWFAYLWMDLIGRQWHRRIAMLALVQRKDALGTVARAFVLSAWPALTVTVFVGGLVLWLRHGWKRIPNGDDSLAGWEEDAAAPTFFGRSAPQRTVFYAHSLVVGCAGALMLALAARNIGNTRAPMNSAIVVLGTVQGALAGMLLLLVAGPWLLHKALPKSQKFDPTGANAITFACAAIGAASSHAAFSGLGLLMVDRLRGWPHLPAANAAATFTTGAAIATPQNYVIALGLALTLCAVWALTVKTTGERLVALARRGTFLARGIAFGCAGAGLWFLWHSVRTHKWLDQTPIATGSFGYRVGAIVMTALPAALFRTVRQTAKPSERARTIAITWDILTYWPRRFHPLGVPAYAEVAVPRLAEEIRAQLNGDASLLVSAHSQGTVLATAAISRLRADLHLTKRIHLCTYGSPISVLYERAFPGHFPSAAYTLASSQALGSWRNFWRVTDPIGGPIGGPVHDVELSDPPGPKATWLRSFEDAAAPLEWARSPADGKSRHSWYLTDPTLKTYVRALRSGLL